MGATATAIRRTASRFRHRKGAGPLRSSLRRAITPRIRQNPASDPELVTGLFGEGPDFGLPNAIARTKIAHELSGKPEFGKLFADAKRPGSNPAGLPANGSRESLGGGARYSRAANFAVPRSSVNGVLFIRREAHGPKIFYPPLLQKPICKAPYRLPDENPREGENAY